ncbi:hypothetical protein MTO96_037716 [Rhipicephalus appendiculatus]
MHGIRSLAASEEDLGVPGPSRSRGTPPAAYSPPLGPRPLPRCPTQSSDSDNSSTLAFTPTTSPVRSRQPTLAQDMLQVFLPVPRVLRCVVRGCGAAYLGASSTSRVESLRLHLVNEHRVHVQELTYACSVCDATATARPSRPREPTLARGVLGRSHRKRRRPLEASEEDVDEPGPSPPRRRAAPPAADPPPPSPRSPFADPDDSSLAESGPSSSRRRAAPPAADPPPPSPRPPFADPDDSSLAESGPSSPRRRAAPPAADPPPPSPRPPCADSDDSSLAESGPSPPCCLKL